MGSWLGQKTSNWLGSGEEVNAGAVIGAGIGGLFGGTLQGFIAEGLVTTTVAGEWGAEFLGSYVGGIPSMGGDLIGKYLSTESATPQGTPWQDSGTPADWLRAAGCKP